MTVARALRFATREAFEALSRERLDRMPVRDVFDPARAAPRGDRDLNQETQRDFRLSAIKPAAVLVPVLAGADGLAMLLTVRHAGLSAHAGQVAFPGGRIDAGDADPLAAALRETKEELGILPAAVEPLGYLDAYETGNGYRVVPVVGLLAADTAVMPAPEEVAETFTVPLDFLLDPANHRRESREWRGKRRWFYSMPYGERLIWGATAGMIRNLYERLM